MEHMLRNISLPITLALACSALNAQTARVQVIHNCADAAAAQVDVYLSGILLLNDFAFRTATPFVEAPAGIPISVAVAPSTSTSAAEAIYTQSYTLADGGTYIIVADGIVSTTGYMPEPAFGLQVYDMGREVAANGSGETDVLVHHGCTDAPTVDVYESGVVNATIVDDASYLDFAGYLELPTADYTLDVRTADGITTVASYQAPLATLGLGGAAITVLASGFLAPSMNSDGPAFGLWVALAAGGPLVELPLAVGINDNFLLNNLAVSPNPTMDLLRLSTSVPLDASAFIQVQDAAGRQIMSFRPQAIPQGPEGVTLDMSALEPGMYRLQVTSGDRAGTLPFQKL